MRVFCQVAPLVSNGIVTHLLVVVEEAPAPLIVEAPGIDPLELASIDIAPSPLGDDDPHHVDDVGASSMTMGGDLDLSTSPLGMGSGLSASL